MSTGNAYGSAEAVAEHAWGFQRLDEPTKEPEKTTLKFWLDGRFASLEKAIENRSADPDVPLNRDDIERMIRESARIGAMYGSQYGGYTEAPKPRPDPWSKWMVTAAGLLAVSGIGSAIGMYGRLYAIEANQISQQKQIDYLIQIVVRRPQ